jgi:hypothetical protein
MDWAEACRILGVPESATDTEIKEQYLYKAQLLHPDKNQDKPENVRKKAEAEFALINQAYTFLLNPHNNPYKIPPKLFVEPTAIRFKDVRIGEKKSTTLTVRNVGGPYTSIWIDNQPALWLTVTGVKSITSDRLPLEVTLECTGTGEPGKQYFGDLSIKLENETTHAVDQAIVKIELYTQLKSAQPGTAKKSGEEVIPDKAAPQAAGNNKLGFSPGTFLVNLLAFATLGIVLIYIINVFLKLNELVIIISLILFSAIAIGLSVSHGIAVGSKPPKAKSKNPKI